MQHAIFPMEKLMSRGPVGIFVATMTGLAYLCAEEIAGAMNALGIESEIHLMDGLEADALKQYRVFVIVSSTYGHGEIPDNGQSLFESLTAEADLSGRNFALFALGDRTYSDTFCAAGDRWAAALAACRAEPIVDVERHDASGGNLAEDVAGDWARGWVDALLEQH
jgi:flavodoxin